MMSSLGSGMQALSIPMSRAIPAYDRVAITYTQKPPKTAKITFTIAPGALTRWIDQRQAGALQGRRVVPGGARRSRADFLVGDAVERPPIDLRRAVRHVGRVLDLDQDGGDVVLAAPLIRSVNQTPA